MATMSQFRGRLHASYSSRTGTETRGDVVNDNGDNLRPNQLPGALRRRCESTTLTTFIVNNTLRAKQHIARFEEDILTTDGTDGHGNARDVVNDNGDNIPRKSISLRGAGYVYQQRT